MRYSALACDYDGTIAVEGRVSDDVLASLRRFRASGRLLLLITGRLLDDLQATFPHTGLFDRVVVENGALLFQPATGEVRVLAAAPPSGLEATLRARGVNPMSAGRVIVAATVAHEPQVRAAVRELKLDVELILNKGSVMVLPAGVTKATGLAAALQELGLRPDAVVGIGDAENDQDFLRRCGLAVAVGDALPTVRAEADWVTQGGAGAGVIELIDFLLKEDFSSGPPKG